MLTMRLQTWWGSQSLAWPHTMKPQAEPLFGLGRFACVATLVSTLLVFQVESASSTASAVWMIPFGLLAIAAVPGLITLFSGVAALMNRSAHQDSVDPPQVIVGYFSLFPATAFAVVLQTLYRIA